MKCSKENKLLFSARFRKLQQSCLNNKILKITLGHDKPQ